MFISRIYNKGKTITINQEIEKIEIGGSLFLEGKSYQILAMHPGCKPAEAVPAWWEPIGDGKDGTTVLLVE